MQLILRCNSKRKVMYITVLYYKFGLKAILDNYRVSLEVVL